MRKNIHPEYHEATVKCVCGNEFKTRSTLKEISVEICANCHPFFTGQQKLVDSAGRVERFMRKYGREYAPAGHAAYEDKPEAGQDKPETDAADEKPDAKAAGGEADAEDK